MWQNLYTFQPIVLDHGPPAPLFAEILRDQNLRKPQIEFGFIPLFFRALISPLEFINSFILFHFL